LCTFDQKKKEGEKRKGKKGKLRGVGDNFGGTAIRLVQTVMLGLHTTKIMNWEK
jgi:hypothetical protein